MCVRERESERRREREREGGGVRGKARMKELRDREKVRKIAR